GGFGGHGLAGDGDVDGGDAHLMALATGVFDLLLESHEEVGLVEGSGLGDGWRWGRGDFQGDRLRLFVGRDGWELVRAAPYGFEVDAAVAGAAFIGGCGEFGCGGTGARGPAAGRGHNLRDEVGHGGAVCENK